MVEHWQDLIGPSVQVVLAAGTVIWAIFTKTLSASIDHLREAIADLKESQHELARDFFSNKERLASDFAALKERVGAIETRCRVYHRIQDE
jgi:hypothetical protein